MPKVRVRIGDVIEIATSSGMAYVQLTHRHSTPPHYGDLVRVLPGIFEQRPIDIEHLVQQLERFACFCAVSTYSSRGEAEVIGNYAIPEHCKPFPVFKQSNWRVPAPDMVWYLWDGVQENKVDKLPPEAIDYPVREIPDLKVLCDRIESNWHPRDIVHPDSIARPG